MKKAGDLLSVIIDNKMMGKAREYSRLFSIWEQLTGKHDIAAAANHSRIQDIRHGVLLVEADHPGWIQILQTKEHKLLSDLQTSFPGIGINGIAFRLSKTPLGLTEEAAGNHGNSEEQAVSAGSAVESAAEDEAHEEVKGYEAINDRALKEKLKMLEEKIRKTKE